MVEILRNNGTFFNELNRNVNNENLAKNTRTPSLVNTYQNEPKFQQAQNLSCNYARIGQQKFKDPFAFHMRPYDNYYDGRILRILDTLKINAKKDYPDVKTANPLKVAGYY
jgi:hypothetical protein